VLEHIKAELSLNFAPAEIRWRGSHLENSLSPDSIFANERCEGVCPSPGGSVPQPERELGYTSFTPSLDFYMNSQSEILFRTGDIPLSLKLKPILKEAKKKA